MSWIQTGGGANVLTIPTLTNLTATPWILAPVQAGDIVYCQGADLAVGAQTILRAQTTTVLANGNLTLTNGTLNFAWIQRS